jgi:glycosyltransferase involved in cell wall biosynthesis
MRVAYVQYTNPGGYPPLEHSSHILAGRGWRVLFLGIGAFGASALKFPPHPSITVRQLEHCPPGVRQKLHYLWFNIWVVFAVLAFRANWVYASDAWSCPVALGLSFLPGIRILYHEHDSPASATGSGFLGLVLRCRRRLARRARLCILPNPERARRFLREAGGATKAISVWNCPRREEISEARLEAPGNGVWLHYHGSISGELMPLSVLYALAELPEFVKLRVIGYETIGSQGYSERMKETARQLGVLHRMELPGAMPRYELLQHCRQSDIGLALMPRDSSDSNMQAMAGASNKAFDYLACGLALVVSDLPDWRSMFVESGYGVACCPEDHASITAALRNLIGDPGKIRAMGECGRQRIEREWNYERQFEPVVAAMEA